MQRKESIVEPLKIFKESLTNARNNVKAADIDLQNLSDTGNDLLSQAQTLA